MKCDRCLNARTIVSENGLHSACCLSDDELRLCLLHQEDYFIENPMKKEPEE